MAGRHHAHRHQRARSFPNAVIPHLAERTEVARRRGASPSTVVFLAMFASQSGVLVLSPILSDVAEEFDISIAHAGQLRLVAAPLAAVAALAAGRALARFSPRALLLGGAVLLALGSLASAFAPRSGFSALRRYRCGPASRSSSQQASQRRRRGASRKAARDWLPTPSPGLHPHG